MSEPFPLLGTTADAQFQASSQTTGSNVNGSVKENDGGARRRRKSSALGGGNIVGGDTGAPALASSRASINANDPNYAGRRQLSSTSESSDPSAPSSNKRLSKRRRARGIVTRMRQTIIKRTWVLPAIVLSLFASGYALSPNESNPLHNFIFLSYKIPSADPSGSAQYGKGPWDFAFVAFYTIVLSFTREFIMQEILRPIARATGLSKGKQARFMEQLYTAIYFAVLGPAGLYVMSKTPVWYFNTTGMYEEFPHKTHLAVVKFYYLFEAAYWAQQAIVLLLGMEKPRKDFKELVCHHVVSLALIWLSYRFHFTYIGIAVYTTHDISDFFLATSKILSYLDSVFVAPFFFVFVGVWVYMRHFINLKIIWSLFTEFRTVGPFELNWETEQYKCELAQYITASLLSALQALNLFWLFLIIRIAVRFITETDLQDDRSDYEDDDVASEKGKQQEKAKSKDSVKASEKR